MGRVTAVGQPIGSDIGEVGIAPDFGKLQVHDLGALIHVDGFLVFTNPQVDVAGHVNHMTSDRHRAFQLVGSGQGEFRLHGGFHQVDVKVIGTRMIGLQQHGALQGCLGVRRTGPGCTVGLPVIPAAHLHIGFGKHAGDIGIIGIFGIQGAHGFQVGAVSGLVVGNPILVIQHHDGPGQVLFHRRAIGQQFHGPLDGLQTFAPGIIRQSLVTAVRIGTHGVGHADIDHGLIAVMAGCLLKRGDGFRKVEAPGHAQALIVKLLGQLRVRGNRPAVITATGHQHGQRRVLGKDRGHGKAADNGTDGQA